MTTRHGAAWGIALLVLDWGEPALGSAPPQACDNIHAVQITVEERLADCDTATLSTLVGRTSGGPRAAFADASWHDDCLGATANACAALHRAHPERTVTALGGGSNMTVVFPETSEQCADGTRPAYYYAPGSGAGANRWVIFLNGSSGKCGTRVDREAGEIQPFGESCLDNIASGEADGSFLLRGAKNESGILSGAPRNPFADWNRVHIPSCSNDQYQGQRIHRDVLVERPPASWWPSDACSTTAFPWSPQGAPRSCEAWPFPRADSCFDRLGTAGRRSGPRRDAAVLAAAPD